MSLIKSKWTKQEIKAHTILLKNKIKHTMHPKMVGKPDIFVNEKNVVIFLHGCFWHGCKEHYKRPETNKKYWSDKILKNKLRDKKNIDQLKRRRYRVLVIWEHQMRDNKNIILNRLRAIK